MHRLVLILALFAACRAERAPDAVRAAEPAPTYATVLEELDVRIRALEKRAETRTDDWLVRAHLASLLLERAGLTHAPADEARVQRVLHEAFAIAPAGSGPLLVAARFEAYSHRFARAEELLDELDARPLSKSHDRVAAQLLRAEVALERGRHADALAALRDVGEAGRTVLALYHAKTGGRIEAEAILHQALHDADPGDKKQLAWIGLQLGKLAMDAGRLDEALARFRAADAALPGWWMIEARIAEVASRREVAGPQLRAR
jgi:tetratricopeptide (TPR) repeat protein